MDNELLKEREEFWKLQYKKIDEKVLSIPPIKRHEYQEIKDDVRLVYELLEEKHPKKFSERIIKEKGKDNYVMSLTKEQIFVRLIKKPNTVSYIYRDFNHKKYSLDNLKQSVWFRDLQRECEIFNNRNQEKFSAPELEDICGDAYYILQTIYPPPPLKCELGYFINKKVAPQLFNAKRKVKIKTTSLEGISTEEEAMRSDLASFYEVEIETHKKTKESLMDKLKEAIRELPIKKQLFIDLRTKNVSKEKIAEELGILPQNVNDFAYDTRIRLVKKLEKKGISIESLKKFFYNED